VRTSDTHQPMNLELRALGKPGKTEWRLWTNLLRAHMLLTMFQHGRRSWVLRLALEPPKILLDVLIELASPSFVKEEQARIKRSRS